jgi:hypothetical protein
MVQNAVGNSHCSLPTVIDMAPLCGYVLVDAQSLKGLNLNNPR